MLQLSATKSGLWNIARREIEEPDPVVYRDNNIMMDTSVSLTDVRRLSTGENGVACCRPVTIVASLGTVHHSVYDG